MTGTSGRRRRELRDRGHAAHARHGQVEEHRVEIGVIYGKVEPGGGVAGFQHNGARIVVRQQRGDALPHDGLVVDDEKLHRGSPRAWS